MTNNILFSDRQALGVIAAVVPIATGWWATLAIAPAVRRMPFPVRLVLAASVGWAIAAVHFLLFRAADGHSLLTYRLIEAVVLPLAACTAARIAAPAEPLTAAPRRRWGPALLNLAILGAAAVVIWGELRGSPLGYWDGWAIWNLKARCLFRDGPHWTAMFQRDLWFSHPDYPLLLPASVARVWSWIGGEDVLVPQMISLAFALAVIALLAGALVWLRGPMAGCVGALVLIASERFLYYGGGQLADIPLSVYVLGTFVLLAAASARPEQATRLHLLAGVMAGFGAFTKNEGLVVLLCLVGAMLAWRIFSRPASRFTSQFAFAIGLIPGLALVALQKVAFCGASYLVADQPSLSAVLYKALDPARHGIILQHLWQANLSCHWCGSIPVPNNLSLWLLVLAAAALPLSSSARPSEIPPIRTPAPLALIATFVAYYVVFLVMPYDLEDLMQSFPRVLLHIWPALIFTVLWTLCRPTCYPQPDGR